MAKLKVETSEFVKLRDSELTIDACAANAAQAFSCSHHYLGIVIVSAKTLLKHLFQLNLLTRFQSTVKTRD